MVLYGWLYEVGTQLPGSPKVILAQFIGLAGLITETVI